MFSSFLKGDKEERIFIRSLVYNETIMDFIPRFLARFLDRMTMYRLILYFLFLLLSAAILLSALGVLPYNGWDIFLQTILFVLACWGLNEVIAYFSKTKPNPESAVITGLILAAITGPLSLPHEWLTLVILAGAAILSKYILIIRHSHIFNPAAYGAVVAGILGFGASWWVGNKVLVPIILIGGLLITQKIRRLHLIVSFLVAYGVLLAFDTLFVYGGSLLQIAALFNTLLVHSPLLFFSFIMLVEPATSPQTKKKRVYFGAFIALIFFAFQWFTSSVAFSLELSLLLGNIFSRIINPDFRQPFILRKKETLSSDVSGFWFEPFRPFPFTPGQFLEYTLAHTHPDTRGTRRYFSIASAPHETQVLLVTKFSEPGSTFKKALRDMHDGDELIASKVAGEFVLPDDPQKKLVFIAGGIGITPFRSMAKDLLEKDEHRNIVLFYAAREEKNLVFRDVFEEAEKIGMRNVYILSNKETVSSGWSGRTGMLDAGVIAEEVLDAKKRIFYISGPEPMVKGISTILLEMGITRRHILRDYFPGYDTSGEYSQT
jgi:ferredoxin-NADP reductase/Na+-translocating ferredoxin:NAD+ oxidoreductase RnfD subunit